MILNTIRQMIFNTYIDIYFILWRDVVQNLRNYPGNKQRYLVGGCKAEGAAGQGSY